MSVSMSQQNKPVSLPVLLTALAAAIVLSAAKGKTRTSLEEEGSNRKVGKRKQAANFKPSHPGSAVQQLQDGRGREAVSPFEIPLSGWKDIAWRTYEEIGNDRLLAVAAGVVFYGLLALFPAITALVSSYALFAEAATIGKHLAFAAALMPAGAFGIVEEQIDRITQTGA